MVVRLLKAGPGNVGPKISSFWEEMSRERESECSRNVLLTWGSATKKGFGKQRGRAGDLAARAGGSERLPPAMFQRQSSISAPMLFISFLIWTGLDGMAHRFAHRWVGAQTEDLCFFLDSSFAAKRLGLRQKLTCEYKVQKRRIESAREVSANFPISMPVTFPVLSVMCGIICQALMVQQCG